MEALSTFHQVLAARRERYNQQFRLARHRARGLDPQEFLTHLREVVGPVVDAVRTEPEAVCDALVELSLALAARGRLGASGAIADGFRRLLPALPGLVAAEPRRFPVAVVNALHHLESSPTGDPAGWVDTMLELGLHTADVTELLDAGAVAAWRRGLAQLRTSALTTAARLPSPLVRVALGARVDVDLERLAADPWLDPALTGRDGEVLLLARRVGGFRGFGGTFRRPPTVAAADGRWYATDGAAAWRVFADRFGVSIGRVAAMPAEPGAAGPLVLAGGVVTDTVTGAALELPELADATSWASADGTLAATTPWTHGILFVARTVG